MKRLRTYSDHLSLALGIVLLLFVIFPKTIALGYAILLIMVVYGWIKGEMTFRRTWFLWLFALLYTAYAIGCFFTRHWDWASTYLENKLSFLILPVLFSFRLKSPLKLQPIAWGLIFGNVIGILLGIINGYQAYQISGNLIGSFTSSYISPIHHPTYFAAFNVITFSLVWWGYHQRWNYFNRSNAVLFTLFSLGVQAVCLSLAGLLFFSLLVGVVIIRRVYLRFGKWVAMGTIVMLPGILLTGVMLVPGMKSDISATGKAFSDYIHDPYGFVQSHPDYKTGNEVRLVMWTVGTSEMLQHPFGVGTGNVDEHLNYRLYRSNQKNMVASDYNPHNQFIQTGVEIGIAGLAILLAILISGFCFARKHRNWLLLILLSNLTFNALFESMLQRSSGIVFFTLMSCILVVYSLSQQKSPENHAD